ncbi:MAG TPA: hypothetical protein DDY13_13780 [Cytophagales bacterium]|nr:hypothetical protein [Cytophagales bacterium]
METLNKKELEFLISHRFGPVSGGGYQLFGLDEANIRLALEYGITEWLQAGIGRSSFEKTYDVLGKARIIRQKEGKEKIPISITYLAAVTYETLRAPAGSPELTASDRTTFTNQILLARKFGSVFSFQLSPSWVHFNYVPEPNDPNDIFALGAAFRFKITPSVHLNGEYYYRFNEFESFQTYAPVGVGVDIETGGHVFQLHFTNARVINEKGFIAETRDDFFAGDIRIGFNISRTFQLGKRPEQKGWWNQPFYYSLLSDNNQIAGLGGFSAIFTPNKSISI